METCECPLCGASASPSERRCSFCKAEFFITSLAYLGQFDATSINKYLKHFKEVTRNSPQDPEGLLGLGLCYLQMGTYPLAEKCFEQVISSSPDISRSYYYYALASIKGRRLKTLNLSEIRKIELYLMTATQLDGELAECQLLLAMLKRDFYEANGMKVPGIPAAELLQGLQGRSISKDELNHLKTAVKVATEDQFYGLVTAI